MYSVDIYLTDKINIITTSYDEWGKKTTSTQENISARIENSNKMIRDKEGQEVVANSFVIVDHNAVLKHESFIQLVSQNGEATQTPNKQFAIKKLLKAHGFKASHWEVYI